MLSNRYLGILVVGAFPLIACARMLARLLGSAGIFPSILYRDIVNPGSLAYKYTILVPNFIEHGLVRRGLGGTLLVLISGNRSLEPMGSLVAFHIVSAIWLTVPLALLLRRLAGRGGRDWIWFGLVLIAAPHLFLGWSQDVGRVDMLALGFIAWSMLAMVQGRYSLAVLPLLGGFLVHELAIIYGSCLLFAMWCFDKSRGAVTNRHGLVTLGILVAGVLALGLAQIFFSVSNSALAADMLSSSPPSFNRDKATYLTVTGLRSLVTSLCMSYGRASTPLFIAANFVLLAVYSRVLMIRSLTSLAVLTIASALPMALITLLAMDYGRWLMLAVMSGWFAAVGMCIKAPGSLDGQPRDYAVAAALIAMLLAMGLPTVHTANPAMDKAALRIFGKAGLERKLLIQCDPGWRRAIYVAANRP